MSGPRAATYHLRSFRGRRGHRIAVVEARGADDLLAWAISFSETHSYLAGRSIWAYLEGGPSRPFDPGSADEARRWLDAQDLFYGGRAAIDAGLAR